MAVVFACICHMFKYLIVCVFSALCICQIDIFLIFYWFLYSHCAELSHNPVQTTTFFPLTEEICYQPCSALTKEERDQTENSAIVLFRITWKIWICFCTECLFFFSFFLLAHIFLNCILQSHQNWQHFHRKMNPSELGVPYHTTWCSCIVKATEMPLKRLCTPRRSMESHWTPSVWISVYIYFFQWHQTKWHQNRLYV